MATLRSNYSTSSQGSHRSPRSQDRTSPSLSSYSHGSYSERSVGGRDRRGGPILTFPGDVDASAFSTDDVISCLTYLSSIPRIEMLPPTINKLFHCLGKRVFAAYLILPEKQKLNLSFRKEKAQYSFQYQQLTASKLQTYVSRTQITPELGGSLLYRHDLWLKNRLEFEKFLREAKAVSKHLDTQISNLSRQLKKQKDLTPDDLLRQREHLLLTVIQSPEKILTQGQDLYRQLQSDAESGFQSSFTQDHTAMLKQIQRTMEQLSAKLDHVQNLWRDKEWEVVEWVSGPAEKLLASQTDIGDSYKTAEELRKQHEQLELKCTDTYGTYAELRHRAQEVIGGGTEKAVDIEAQRDYMDTVCRSFASRLERRRNLVISSLSQQLDVLLEVLCGDLVTDTVAQTETALENIKQKLSEVGVTAEQTFDEGQNLLDQLSLPVKNASGQDVTPDNRPHMERVERILASLRDRKSRCDELADMKYLKAIIWLLELCDVALQTQVDVSHDTKSVPGQQAEQRKLEETAKSTYEYGKQLLQAALVLRRSLHHDLKPNHERAMRLLDVWKKFSQGVNERASRLNGIAVFHKNADSVCCCHCGGGLPLVSLWGWTPTSVTVGGGLTSVTVGGSTVSQGSWTPTSVTVGVDSHWCHCGSGLTLVSLWEVDSTSVTVEVDSSPVSLWGWTPTSVTVGGELPLVSLWGWTPTSVTVEVLDGIAELLVVVSQTVNAEMSVERLVRDHSRTREQLMRHKKDTVVTGQHLLDRLAVPVLVQDGDSKQMRVEDEGVSEVIREKIALMHQKIAVLNTHWLEETKGLHLSPDGILLTPDGRPLPDQTRGGENIVRTPDGRMLDQSVVDGRGAQNGVDREGRMETQMLTSEYGQWRSLDDEWRHLVEALREKYFAWVQLSQHSRGCVYLTVSWHIDFLAASTADCSPT
ncbi:hypothetical protein NP493_191g00009 [Ridgeia piscesae]|uniref:SESTD1-like spectrin repeats region domain-containing protein n=1 Tax=Ridgeia piscesae TaxID=27915 RepID=A0AAD9UEP1_RIDPI|nr:hypothetical protein NP493_191g00009 [Ridgeia piscesae]